MIAIYSNTKIWGGVDVLVARLGDHLAARKVSFIIVDSVGSRLRTERPSYRFVTPETLGDCSVNITHVLFPSLSLIVDPSFPWEKLGHARMLAWAVHPNDAFRSFFPFSGKYLDIVGFVGSRHLELLFRKHYKITTGLFKVLLTNGALVVMDGAAKRALHHFYPALDAVPPTVQIPAPAKPLASARTTSSDIRAIGYLGRVDSFKWTALRPFISSTLSSMAKSRPVELHAVSEGDHVQKMADLCRFHNIKFSCHGFLPNEEARRVLVENTDLVVAMGTSALDIAGAGHPCVILDPALGVLAPSQRKFRFVHETDDFTIGEFRGAPEYVVAKRSFEQCFDRDLLRTSAAAGIAYVSANHNPDACFNELIRRLLDSNQAVADIRPRVVETVDSFWATKRHPIRSTLVGRSHRC